MRSEWFKYAGVFFNRDIEANLLYSAIRNTYNSLVRAAAQARTGSGKPNPVVLWIYKGWAADFVVSYPLFKRTYIQVSGTSDDCDFFMLLMHIFVMQVALTGVLATSAPVVTYGTAQVPQCTIGPASVVYT